MAEVARFTKVPKGLNKSSVYVDKYTGKVYVKTGKVYRRLTS